MVSSYNHAGKTNLNHVGLCINFHSIIEAGLKFKIKIKLCNKDQSICEHKRLGIVMYIIAKFVLLIASLLI